MIVHDDFVAGAGLQSFYQIGTVVLLDRNTVSCRDAHQGLVVGYQFILRELEAQSLEIFGDSSNAVWLADGHNDDITYIIAVAFEAIKVFVVHIDDTLA